VELGILVLIRDTTVDWDLSVRINVLRPGSLYLRVEGLAAGVALNGQLTSLRRSRVVTLG